MLSFWGSVIGGLISGWLTLLGVRLTIQYYQEKDEELRKEKEQLQKEKEEDIKRERFKRKPEFEITNHKFYKSNGESEKCDLEVYYDEIKDVRINDVEISITYADDILDSSKYCSVVYELKNIGKTDVMNFVVYTNSKKYRCLFDIKELKSDVGNGFLSYSALWDKKIKTGESIKVKIIYNKDRVLGNMLSASLSIGFQDVFSTCWSQPLFAPSDKIYCAYEISEGEYWTRQGIEDALACFRGEAFW